MRLVPILVLATAIALVLVGCSQAPAGTSATGEASTGKASTVQTVSGAEALEMMEQETDHLIVDVRTAEEYASGHIPEAINIPVETIGSDPIPELPDTDQTIFVYCRSGRRSAQAASTLVAQGYARVIDMGGIIDWPGEVVTD